ncbi:MAG: DUF2752 domain-containing protein [Bacillota bacterium]
MALLLALPALVLILDGNLCIIKNIFGIPCPGCGMTRAYLNFLKFDFKAAFYYHPLFLLPAVIAVILVFRRYKYFSLLYSNNLLWFTLTGIFICTWVIRLVLLFPDKAPMDYNPGALIPMLLHYFNL